MGCLTVIEPNLSGPAGHYAEFVSAIASALDPAHSIRVLASSLASPDILADARSVSVVPAINPRRKRRDEFEVLSAANAAKDPFLVLTARFTDVLMLEAVARRTGVVPEHANLYFHWRESTLLRRSLISACPIVRRCAVAIAPTSVTAEHLRRTGWTRVHCVPYPARRVATQESSPPFRHLLVAGAVRANKGIEHVADALPELMRRGCCPRLIIQTTRKRLNGREGSRERRAIDRIEATGYPTLTLDPEAPDSLRYDARFRGALTLTPYDPIKFSDNVSGIALDALLRGSPVVATAGTWQAGLIERFGAGRVMDAWDGMSLAACIESSLERWADLSAAARAAACVLANEHDPSHLNQILFQGQRPD